MKCSYKRSNIHTIAEYDQGGLEAVDELRQLSAREVLETQNFSVMANPNAIPTA